MGPAGGCYGFRIGGVHHARELLVDAPAEWPGVSVTTMRANDAEVPGCDMVGPDRAVLPLHRRGWTEIRRHGRRITFHLPEPPEHQELVHPYLAPAAAVLAHWSGRESFHAGAVIADGGAWAVLGGREDGKSSTLAWLALHGHGVLADDLVVLDDGLVMAGPRCIDLRADAASRLGTGEPLGVVGTRERWRMQLARVPAHVPLRGWIVLQWGDEVRIERLRAQDRLMALIAHRSVRLTPPAAGALVELSSRPMLALQRPRRWDAMPDVAARLWSAIAVNS